MVASKQDIGNTKRHFSTMNNVRHQWRIQPQPPLRGVDLVNCARTVDIARGTKKPLSNKEGITRFVKTVLELVRSFNYILAFSHYISILAYSRRACPSLYSS